MIELKPNIQNLLPNNMKDKLIILLEDQGLLIQKNLDQIYQNKSCLKTQEEYFSRLHSLFNRLSYMDILNQSNIETIFNNIEYALKTERIWQEKIEHLKDLEETEEIDFQKEFDFFFKKTPETENMLTLLNIKLIDKQIYENFIFVMSYFHNPEQENNIYNAFLKIIQEKSITDKFAEELKNSYPNEIILMDLISSIKNTRNKYLSLAESYKITKNIHGVREVYKKLLCIDTKNIKVICCLLQDCFINQKNFNNALIYINQILDVLDPESQKDFYDVFSDLKNAIENYGKSEFRAAARCLNAIANRWKSLNNINENDKYFLTFLHTAIQEEVTEKLKPLPREESQAKRQRT